MYITTPTYKTTTIERVTRYPAYSKEFPWRKGMVNGPWSALIVTVHFDGLSKGSNFVTEQQCWEFAEKQIANPPSLPTASSTFGFSNWAGD